MREYNHIETWTLQPDRREYGFIYPRDASDSTYRGEQRARVAAAVRVWVENLPPYKATFTAPEVRNNIDPEIGDHELTADKIRPEMLLLADSWLAPEYYITGEQRGQRWVNPNYKDVHLYTDGSAECECGQLVTKLNNTGGNAKFGDVRHHNDDCLPEWRADMIRRLIERRRRIFYIQGLLGKSARSLSDRLHTVDDDVIHMYRSAFDTPYKSIRDRGREKRNKTIVRMLNEGIADDVIVELFGLSKSTIRNIVRRDTVYDLGDLRAGEVAL